MFSTKEFMGCQLPSIHLSIAHLECVRKCASSPAAFTPRPFASPFNASNSLDLIPELCVEGKLEVYGVKECLGSASEPNHSLIVVHDVGRKKAYVLFSGQCLSNFNGCSGPESAFGDYDVLVKESGEVVSIANQCSESGFQLAKAGLSGADCMSNFEQVLMAQKPSGAKMATNFKNMPKCSPAWSECSEGVMTACILRKLKDVRFFDVVNSLVMFCVEVLRIGDVKDIAFMENTDDGVWGNGMKVASKEGLYSEAAVALISESEASEEVEWKGKNLLSKVFETVKEVVWGKTHEEVVDILEKELPPFFIVVEKKRGAEEEADVEGESSKCARVEA